MRREGRQHGTVRTHLLLPSSALKSRVPNRLDAPPAAGVFARAPAKPNNHSKFTGGCGTPMCPCCHAKPAWKSKGKTKGQRKARAEFRDELRDRRDGPEGACGNDGRRFGEDAEGACGNDWPEEEDEVRDDEALNEMPQGGGKEDGGDDELGDWFLVGTGD